jgi:hypothetical protein
MNTTVVTEELGLGLAGKLFLENESLAVLNDVIVGQVSWMNMLSTFSRCLILCLSGSIVGFPVTEDAKLLNEFVLFVFDVAACTVLIVSHYIHRYDL